jgi:hypothetical protein
LQTTQFETFEELFQFFSPAFGEPAIRISIDKGIVVINGKTRDGAKRATI